MLYDNIRERLFLEPEVLTLENAVVLAQSIQRATSESKRLSKASKNYQPSSLKQVDSGGSYWRSETTCRLRQTNAVPSRTADLRLNNATTSPTATTAATNVINNKIGARLIDVCRSCGIPNHFEPVCQSSKGQRHKSPRTSSSNHRNHNGNDKVLNTIKLGKQRTKRTDIRVLNDYQHRCTTNDNSNSYVTVELASVNTDLLIDTNAQVSVITKSALSQLSPRISLKTDRNNVKNFGGAHIAVISIITVPVQYREHLVPDCIFYVVQ